MARLAGVTIAALLGAAGLPGAGIAQVPDSSGSHRPAAVTTIVPGSRYAAGWLHGLLWGRHYRELWTVPIAVPLLDLKTFAGGLTPTTAGGRFQSRSLRFLASDGRQFSFRLVDKNPVSILPEELRQTVAADIVQDQTSAGHPAAPLIVGPLLDSVGILHAGLRFMVLRDEPALGAFREEFVGKLGTFEERILPPAPGQRGFRGVTRIVSSDTLFTILAHEPRGRVDARVLLTARLMDLFLGDFDRHRGQWTWAKSGPTPADPWLPVPEDRDQALVRYDGLFLMLARGYYPELLNFGDRYSDLFGATRAGSELDRKLLSGLQWTVWDSVSASVRSKLTDPVIDDAVARMPVEYFPLDSARLATTLKRRRDQLPALALRFYRLLAREADVHATDLGEQVEIERRPDGALDLRILEPETEPLIARRYRPDETKDLRVYLHGGDDRVTVRGQGPRAIALRVIGGDGNDVLVDSAGGTRFYDTDAEDHVTRGRGTKVDRRPSIAPIDSAAPWLIPRDFGGVRRPMPWVTYGPDLGLLVGAGLHSYRFGFRKYPYASKVGVRLGYATLAHALKTELTGDFRRENSRARTAFLARVSQIEILRFHGFGNEVLVPGPADYYKVRQEQLTLHPALCIPLGLHGFVGAGPVLRYARTKLESGRYITLTRPYGTEGFGQAEGFGQVGGRAAVTVDTRDTAAAASRGIAVNLEGSVYPAAWDVRSTFGEVHGDASLYLSARMPLRPTLALRVGAKRVWGAYPFHEAAFLGGAGTLRGFVAQRFAGDASVYGNAELRIHLTRFFLVLPGKLGVFALGDAGRVFLSGESSSTWHTAVGVGFWFAFLSRANTVSIALASSKEKTGLYVAAGFAF